jgi:hypothetical protein
MGRSRKNRDKKKGYGYYDDGHDDYSRNKTSQITQKLSHNPEE